MGVPRGTQYPVVIGLDLAVNDATDDSGRVSQVVWRGSAENAVHPNQYGIAVLRKGADKAQ